MALRIVDIHQRREAFAAEGRQQAVEVAGLHHGAQLLVVVESLRALGALLVGHVLRLQLDAQTPTHGHVAAELHGRDAAAGVPVGHAADVLCHGVGGEEVAGAVLYVDALQGIVVVAHPELVEVRQQAVVGAAATRGAVLNDQVGILRADALQGLDESEVVVDVDVRLLLLRQVE